RFRFWSRSGATTASRARPRNSPRSSPAPKLWSFPGAITCSRSATGCSRREFWTSWHSGLEALTIGHWTSLYPPTAACRPLIAGAADLWFVARAASTMVERVGFCRRLSMAHYQVRPALDTVDPVWVRVRREAEEVVKREPELATFIYSTILHHDTLEGAIVYR